MRKFHTISPSINSIAPLGREITLTCEHPIRWDFFHWTLEFPVLPIHAKSKAWRVFKILTDRATHAGPALFEHV